MAIQVKCSNCDESYDVTEKLAGQSVTCMKCGSSFTVPDVPVDVIKATERKPPENQDFHAGPPSGTSPPSSGMNRQAKYWKILVIGVATTIIRQLFSIRNASAPYVAVKVCIQPISYLVILGLIALVVGAIRRDVRKYWFSTLAWLFLSAGLVDIVVGGYTEFVLKPHLQRQIKQLYDKGILKDSDA